MSTDGSAASWQSLTLPVASSAAAASRRFSRRATRASKGSPTCGAEAPSTCSRCARTTMAPTPATVARASTCSRDWPTATGSLRTGFRLPKKAEFKDYAAISYRDGRLAVVSQESARLFVARIDERASRIVRDRLPSIASRARVTATSRVLPGCPRTCWSRCPTGRRLASPDVVPRRTIHPRVSHPGRRPALTSRPANRPVGRSAKARSPWQSRAPGKSAASSAGRRSR